MALILREGVGQKRSNSRNCFVDAALSIESLLFVIGHGIGDGVDDGVHALEPETGAVERNPVFRPQG